MDGWMDLWEMDWIGGCILYLVYERKWPRKFQTNEKKSPKWMCVDEPTNHLNYKFNELNDWLTEWMNLLFLKHTENDDDRERNLYRKTVEKKRREKSINIVNISVMGEKRDEIKNEASYYVCVCVSMILYNGMNDWMIETRDIRAKISTNFCFLFFFGFWFSCSNSVFK